MSTYKPLTDMVEPSIEDWGLVASNVKVSFQQNMKKEYSGKSYSRGYAKAKSEGTAVRSDPNAKQGVGQASYSTNPDLTLTGNMLKEITATSTGNQAKLEWNGANAEKITQLDKGGKFPMFVGETPASKNVNKDIEKFVNKLYDRRVKAQSQKIVYKI